MGDITKDDVTVTLSPLKRFFPEMPLVLSLPTVSWGSGMTYPADGHGVPMPDGLFGMKKGIHYIPPALYAGYVCIYDKTYDTIRVYQSAGSAAPLAELAAGASLPAISVDLMVIGE